MLCMRAGWWVCRGSQRRQTRSSTASSGCRARRMQSCHLFWTSDESVQSGLGRMCTAWTLHSRDRLICCRLLTAYLSDKHSGTPGIRFRGTEAAASLVHCRLPNCGVSSSCCRIPVPASGDTVSKLRPRQASTVRPWHQHHGENNDLMLRSRGSVPAVRLSNVLALPGANLASVRLCVCTCNLKRLIRVASRS